MKKTLRKNLTERLGADFIVRVDGPHDGFALYQQRKTAPNLREIAVQVASGQTVTFRPRGNSMTGKVNDGDEVTVTPVKTDTVLTKGDVVLVHVGGKVYLHLIKAVGSDKRYQIGNNKGRINGWVTRDSIYGIMTRRVTSG